MKILMIDNYDSFTYNLVQYLSQLGGEVTVIRNDKVDHRYIIGKKRPDAIVISPGPGRPDKAGNCIEIVRECNGEIPILGVCLGHQAIGQAFGGRIDYAPKLMHGKVSQVKHSGHRLFSGVPREFQATRYHSLVVSRKGLPGKFQILAEADGGTIMAVKYSRYPTFGIQFHPESFLTGDGMRILRNFMRLAKIFNSGRSRKRKS